MRSSKTSGKPCGSRASARVDGWLDEFERTICGIEPVTAKQEAVHGHWLSQAAERQEGRRGRLAEAAPVVPPVVWAVLILAGLLVIGYICFYADPAEPVLVQAFMMTTVTTMVVSGLLVVRISDVRTRRAAAAYGPWPWREGDRIHGAGPPGRRRCRRALWRARCEGGPTIGEVIRWVVTWPASAAVDVSAVRNGCSDSTDQREAHELEVT